MITNLFSCPPAVYERLCQSRLVGADMIDFGTHPCFREFFGAHWYAGDFRLSLYFNRKHWFTLWYGVGGQEGYRQILWSSRLTPLLSKVQQSMLSECPPTIDLDPSQHTVMANCLRERSISRDLRPQGRLVY